MLIINSIINRIAKNAHEKEVIEGSITSLFFKVLSGVVSLIFSISIARILGVHDSGLFFLALALLSVFSVISQVGLDLTLTRFIGSASSENDWGRISASYQASLLIILVVSFFLSVIINQSAEWLARSIFHKPDILSVLKILSYALIPMSIYWMHAHCYQGLKNMRLYQLFQNLSVNLIFVGSLFLAVYFYYPKPITLVNISLFYLMATISTASVALFVWNFNHNHTASKILPTAINLFRTAMPIFGATLFGLVAAWSGHLFLGIWGSAEDVAIFSVAIRTSALLSVLLMATNSISLPKFSALHYAGDLDGLKSLAISTTRLSLAFSLPFIFIMAMFPSQIMSIYGEGFVIGGDVLLVLVFGAFINTASGAVGGILGMTGHQKFLLYSSGISAIASIVTCVLLVPAYGAIGAAFAFTIAITTQMLLNTWAVSHIFGFIPLGVHRRK